MGVPLAGVGRTRVSHPPATHLAKYPNLEDKCFHALGELEYDLPYRASHYPSVPFYRLAVLHQEVEESLGFALPSAPYFKLHWGHLRALMAGATELDLCAAHDRSLSEAGHLALSPEISPVGPRVYDKAI